MKIAVFGGSFDPVGNHHLNIVKHLLDMSMFDRIVILPCGPRPDKKNLESLNPVHRAAMLDIAFRDLSPKINIDLSDLERETFTRAIDIEKRFSEKGEAWHVVGYDLIKGGESRDSAIHREWVDGARLWTSSRFIVTKRAGYRFLKQDLPPQSKVLPATVEGSSTWIRNRCFHRQAINELVSSDVAAYIERFGLYQKEPPLEQVFYHIKSPRLLILADKTNPKAAKIEKLIQKYHFSDKPNLVVDIGGGRNKLFAIRQNWRMRLPFFGINAGSPGHLSNEIDITSEFKFPTELIIYHMPVLYVDIKSPDNKPMSVLSFGGVRLERATREKIQIDMKSNQDSGISPVSGDGLMVSTALGPTGYTENIHGFSLTSHIPELLLSGIKISQPAGWRNVFIPKNSTVEFRIRNFQQRPARVFVDGSSKGPVTELRVRASKTASVLLAFILSDDMAGKYSEGKLPNYQKGA